MTARPHRTGRRGGRPRTGRWNRRRDERAAVLIELALVVPLLIVLVMGIADFAVLSSDSIGLRGGVREAAWNASRGIFGATPSADCALRFAGPAPDTNTQKIMCMAKRRSGLAASEVRVAVKVVDIDGATSSSFTAGAGLMVCAIRDVHSATGFFRNVLDHELQRARLTTVILAVDPGTTVGGGAEQPIEGPGDWSFCDPGAPAPR